MSFPQDPRDVRVELYVNDQWADVTTVPVYQRDSITISRGRPNEATAPPPQTCQFTLNNRSGDFSPRNPTGQYYGSFDRNTPVRVPLRVITDDFGTDVPDGWGSTVTGQAWTTTAGSGGTVAASDWQVSGGTATHSVPAANAYRLSHLATTAYQEIDAAVSVTLAFTDVTGGSIQPGNLVLRAQSTSDYYYVRVLIGTDETVSIGLFEFDGTTVAAQTTVTGLTHTTAQALRVRAQAEGHTIRAKVWAESAGEPYDFQVSGHTTAIVDTGWLGVFSLVNTGNSNTKPVVFTYDNWEVRIPRFAGELSDIRQGWDTSGRDVYTNVDAGGISRRLGQGADALDSPSRRYITNLPTSGTSADVIAWWPLEDGPDTVLGERAAGPYWMEIREETADAVKYAADTTPPGAPTGPTIGPGGKLYGAVLPATLTTAWSVAWTHKCAIGGGTELYFNTTSAACGFYMVFGTNGAVTVWVVQNGAFTAILGYQVTVGGWLENDWHHYVVSVAQNGANVDMTLYVDGVLADADAVASVTLGALREVVFLRLTAATDPVTTISHVVVLEGTPGTWPSGQVGDLADACLGHGGETAGARIERLCDQESVPFAYIGDLTTTAMMGPQAADTLLNLLTACANADMGTLYESRGVTGFVYRTRGSLYNQSAVLDLDYTAGEIAPPFVPVDDDQNTRNDVTVTRSGGSSARAVLESGRMSVLPPQDGGAGRYTDPETVHVETDEQLPDIAGWRLRLGTVNETRYPRVKVDLSNPTVVAAAIESAVLALDVDDRVTISNPKPGQTPDQITQIARGYTERISGFEHNLTLNCAPESPYHVLTLDDDVLGKLGSDDSTLNEDLDTTEAAVDVVVAGTTLWTTDAGEMPIPIVIGGEEMSVTAITGALSPQTFTVTRSVNGVVKSHSTGDPVRLADRVAIAL